MKNQERLIGKKVYGFKFEQEDEITFDEQMEKYIGEVGVIEKIYTNDVKIVFKEDYFFYPLNQIEDHLVEDEIPTLSDGVIMLVSDNGVDWQTEYVFGQRKGIYLVWNNLIDTSYSTWNHCKTLEPTKEEQLTAILGSSEKVSEIMELFKDKK